MSDPSFGAAIEGVPVVTQIYEAEDGNPSIKVFTKDESLYWAADEIDRLTWQLHDARHRVEVIRTMVWDNIGPIGQESAHGAQVSLPFADLLAILGERRG